MTLFSICQALIQASIDVYKMVKERLKPSPVNPHYVFTLADIAHHVQGMLLMSPRSKTKMLARAKKHADQKHRKSSRYLLVCAKRAEPLAHTCIYAVFVTQQIV